jgi:hypothetical protein
MVGVALLKERPALFDRRPQIRRGLGDGDTINDIQDAALGTPDTEISLRAKRQGSGDGRIYTVTYTATDASNNGDQAVAVVVVPESQKK